MSTFVVLFSVAVFLLAGLLVDGGAAINARLRAADIAEQGARAAADQIDVETLRATGQLRLLGDAEVCGRAGEIVSAHDADGVAMGRCTVGAGQTEVTVEVSVTWEAFFLAAIGFPGSEMTASATAVPESETLAAGGRLWLASMNPPRSRGDGA
uniref:pilus assembly protein TadG-related protein n=1 Tax=Herbidospora sakaeratensis TaxID=564415 RepID=UPI0012FBF05B|nr:pilus assembly protein TadG-related protein [Herbidospora sakaeratensis]